MSDYKVASIIASAGLLFFPMYTLAAEARPSAAEQRPVRDITFVIDLLVDVDGKILDGRVVSSSGNPDNDKHALAEIIRTWKMEPGIEDGKPVRKWGRFSVTFKLQE